MLKRMIVLSRRMIVLTSLVVVFVATAATALADDPPGAKLFGTYCAACHGAGGKGGFAAAVGSEQYLNAHSDAELTQIIDSGTPKGMPAWGKAQGGTLTDEQIGDIVSYLRSFVAPTASVPAPSAATQATNNQVFIETKLTLAPAVNAKGDITLNASLKEYTGYPIVGAKISFARETLFGDLELGTAKTDNAGNASFVLSDVPAETKVVAVFKGDKNWDPSQTKLAVDIPSVASTSPNIRTGLVRLAVDEPLLPPDGSLITPNPPLMPSMLFILVVLGVWTMYGYVAFQLVSIWRRRPKGANHNTLRIGK